MFMITLYTIGCPTCKVLQKKLQQKNIQFETVTDTEKVINFGNEHNIKSAPILCVDDIVYNFKDAINWLNQK